VSIRRFLAAFALVYLLAPIASVAAIGHDFPVPPRPTTEVVDPDGVLSAGARTTLENELEAFESTTGHHVVVYIGQTTGNVPLETWTAETAQTWKVGQKGKDDGAVLFLFMKDHKVRIEVGYGLEGTLTDANASQIITNTIVPQMKSGDTDGAVTNGVAAMLTAISPTYKVTQAAAPADTSSDDEISGPWALVIGAAILIFALFILFFFVMSSVARIKYGLLIKREGVVAAKQDMKKSWLNFFLSDGTASAVATGGFFGSFSSGGGGGGGGFSGGSFGGGFGGGGASGGW
jgi:uncharacterized protein